MIKQFWALDQFDTLTANCSGKENKNIGEDRNVVKS